MVDLYTGNVPNLTQTQPEFDTNTQAILDYIASLAPQLNAWVGAYVQDTSSTSTTSNSIGTGSKTFTVESGKGYKVNMPVRASATSGNFMDGVVTAYSGTSLTVNFTAATGSGTFTSWQIFLTVPGSNVTLGSNTFTGDQIVPDEAYDPTGWNGDLSVPTKNAVRDKIEAILSSILNSTNDPTYASTSGAEPASPEWVNGKVREMLSGVVFDWPGTTAPPGAMALPLVPTNVSRTTYARWFTRFGTTWGSGDGSTTFGMPYCPENFALIQANGNVGSSSNGQMPSHTHSATLYSGTGTTNFAAASIGTPAGSISTGSAGSGSTNLAAGIRMLKCIWL